MGAGRTKAGEKETLSSANANDPGPKNISGNEPPVSITVKDGDAPESAAANRPGWVGTLLYVEVASLVLLFASWDIAGKGYSYGDYSMTVAVVSVTFCFMLQLLQQQSAATLEKELFVLCKLGTISIQRLWALFMLVWWGAGAGVLTFKAPFVGTSNGYFAAWAGLICTALIASKMFSQLQEGAAKAVALAGRARLLFALFACSTVLLLASIDHVDGAEGVWGLSCGVVSTTLVLGIWLFSEQVGGKVAQGVSLLLLAMWIAAAGVLTFRAPFVLTGNGYFSCWLGLLAALMLAMHEFGVSV